MLRELDGKVAELNLLGIALDSQGYGLGRKIIEHLKESYKGIICYMDKSAKTFFSNLGFKIAPLANRHSHLLMIWKKRQSDILADKITEIKEKVCKLENLIKY